MAPIVPIAAHPDLVAHGNTPLHYACRLLNARVFDSGSCYNLKVIILLLMMLGGKDLKNSRKKFALEYLVKDEDLEFRWACTKLLRVVDDCSINILADIMIPQNLLLLLVHCQFGRILELQAGREGQSLEVLNGTLIEYIKRLPTPFQAVVPPVADEFSEDRIGSGYIGMPLFHDIFICTIFNLRTRKTYFISSFFEADMVKIWQYVQKFLGQNFIPDEYKVTIVSMAQTGDEGFVKALAGTFNTFGIKKIYLNFVGPSTSTRHLFDLQNGDYVEQELEACQVIFGHGNELLQQECAIYVASKDTNMGVFNNPKAIAAQLGIQIEQTTQDFMLQQGSGIQLLPFWDLEQKVYQQLDNLTSHALKGEFKNFVTELLAMRGNCITPINPKKGNHYTPLHYVCRQLSDSPPDSKLIPAYKLIIILLLVFGRKDLPTPTRQTGLGYLANIQDKDFKNLCNDLLKKCQSKDKLRGASHVNKSGVPILVLNKQAHLAVLLMADLYFKWSANPEPRISEHVARKDELIRRVNLLGREDLIKDIPYAQRQFSAPH